MVPENWRNYCPDRLLAMGSLSAKSRSWCAEECNFSPQCVDFSYYETSRMCYFYSFVPQQIYYDSDCTFMMDRDALSGCPTKECMQESCICEDDDYYGCLTLTKVNGTLAVCLAPPGLSTPVEMKAVDIDLDAGLGNDSISLLPSVNGWIIILQRFDGSLDFNRSWIDYRNGFGDWKEGQGEFWLGNEKVYLLTTRMTQIFSLRIEVQLYTSGRWFAADYIYFLLDPESNNYAIQLFDFSGCAEDSLANISPDPNGYYYGINFSTRDADNDGSPSINYAERYQAGWWFNDCGMSCLTCPYGKTFAWGSLQHLEPNGTLRAARMMIRAL